MSKRTAFWLAWGTWVLYVIIASVTLLLQIRDDPASWLNDLFDALILLAFAPVGSLVASRRPQNPIGWREATSEPTVAKASRIRASNRSLSHDAGSSLICKSSVTLAIIT